MTAVEDLNAAVARLAAAVAAEIAVLQAANPDNASVEAAATRINELTDQLVASVAPPAA